MDPVFVETILKCKTLAELKQHFPQSTGVQSTTWDEFRLEAENGDQVVPSATNHGKAVMEKWTTEHDKQIEAEWEHFKRDAHELPTDEQIKLVQETMKSTFNQFRAQYPAKYTQAQLIADGVMIDAPESPESPEPPMQ